MLDVREPYLVVCTGASCWRAKMSSPFGSGITSRNSLAIETCASFSPLPSADSAKISARGTDLVTRDWHLNATSLSGESPSSMNAQFVVEWPKSSGRRRSCSVQQWLMICKCSILCGSNLLGWMTFKGIGFEQWWGKAQSLTSSPLKFVLVLEDYVY